MAEPRREEGGLFSIGHMDDERVVRWATLGRKDAGHGLFVVSARAKAVDRFGGEGHQLACGQPVCGLSQGCFTAERCHASCCCRVQNAAMPRATAARRAVANAVAASAAVQVR